jgi:hypothetical protein
LTGCQDAIIKQTYCATALSDGSTRIYSACMSYRYLSVFPLKFGFGSSLMPLSPWAPGLKSPVMSASHQIRDVNLRFNKHACIVSPPPCLNALRGRIDGAIHFFSGDPGPSNLSETRNTCSSFYLYSIHLTSGLRHLTLPHCLPTLCESIPTAAALRSLINPTLWWRPTYLVTDLHL